MSKQPHLGDQELEVLRYVAEHGPLTVGQAVEGFGTPRGLARSTILTVMERLRQKGFVTRRKHGGIYEYVSAKSGAELMRNVVGDFVQRSLAGSVSPFVAYLAEAQKVSDDELAELEDLVNRLQAQRKERTS